MRLGFLTPEKALIFRITHRDNLPWILDHGLHCQSSDVLDHGFQQIGNPDLIEKRPRRRVRVAPGGTLADYIPFYFTPRSPMLYNIKTGYHGAIQRPMEEIVMLVASLRRLAASGVPFVIADRHAYLEAASFSNDLDGLDRVDWAILQACDFSRQNTDDLGKIERYQAEVLIHKHLPVSDLEGVVCYSDDQGEVVTKALQGRGLALKVAVKPGWYF